MKIIQISSCTTSKRFLNWMEHTTIDYKKIYSDILSSVKKGLRVQSRVKSLLMENDCTERYRGYFRYKTTPSYLHLMACGAITTELEKQNDAFRAIIRSDADFECHVIIVVSFCRRDSGQGFVCKFHCAIVCTELQWSIARIDRSISASERKRGNKEKKREVFKIGSCAYLFSRRWRVNKLD